MLIRRRRANLIDMYWSTLRSQRIPEPPAGLDDETARLIATLDQHLAPPDASDAFVDRLWQDLEPAPEATDSRRAWSGPAIDPVQQRRTRTRPVKESEERVIMSDITTTQPEPTTLPERRWTRELLKIAAAIAIFAVIGLVLALVLRDDEDEPVIVQPGPTATPAASATLVPTQAIVATATVAEPTAPANTPTAALPTATVTATEPPATPTSLPVGDLSAIGTLVGEIPMGQQPDFMASAAGAIWVSTTADGTITRVDPSTNTVAAVIPVGQPWGEPNHPIQVVNDGDDVWVMHPGESTIMRIDPAMNTVAQTFVVDDGDIFANDFQRFTVSNGAAWLSATHNNKVVRVDLTSGAVVASVEEVFLAHSIGVTDDAVWVHAASNGTIVRIDPATNQVAAVLEHPDGRYTGVFVKDGEVWAATSLSQVVRIDPATNQPMVTIEMPREMEFVEAVTLGAGSIWITNGSEIYRADPVTGEITAEADAGFAAIFPVFVDGSLWVNDPFVNLTRRIDPAE